MTKRRYYYTEGDDCNAVECTDRMLEITVRLARMNLDELEGLLNGGGNGFVYLRVENGSEWADIWLKDYGNRQGRIVISSSCGPFQSYWEDMGMPLLEFLLRLNRDYLVMRLAHHSANAHQAYGFHDKLWIQVRQKLEKLQELQAKQEGGDDVE